MSAGGDGAGEQGRLASLFVFAATFASLLGAGCSDRGDVGPGRPDGAVGADAASDGADRPADGPSPGLANGVPCNGASQCASGQCVDGVCCESACHEQCNACAEPGTAGKCVTVTGKPRGTVRPVCAGSGACASQCNGSDGMACHYPGSDVQCEAPTCSGGVTHPASFCDRAGGCPPSAAAPCTSGQCADSTRCMGGCSASQPCASGAYCDPLTRACLQQKQIGEGCVSDEECVSQACTDNICCAGRCSGQCQGCAEPGRLGQCVTVSGAPRGSRPACAGAGTCVARCDGTDPVQCKYPSANVQCAGATCSAGISTAAAVCDGVGACTAPVMVACASNQCADSTRCSSGCSAAAPCPSGQYCDSVSSACRTSKAAGATCASDAECSNQTCTDGVCCESRCGGQCQACAEPGMAGKCTTVSGQPRGTARARCPGSGTCASVCDGSDPMQCRYPGSVVQCAGPSCSDGFAKPASVCDGDGACTMPASIQCTSAQCVDSMQCSGGCSTSLPCAATQYCDPATAVCIALKTNGTACAADFECRSTACVDGVCCDSRCSGQCEACAESGDKGKCVAVTGSPRGNTRPACAGTSGVCRGQCDGLSRTQCRYPGGSVQCLPPSCNDGTLTTASVCTGGGDCTVQTTGTCHSTQCLGPTQCLDNCSAAAPCSTGFYCDAGGVCHPQIGSGACQMDAQCFSGHCVDGVCCNEACNDGCRHCNLAGSSGICASRFTEFSPAQGTSRESVLITVGPDNNLWFLEDGTTNSFMGRITPDGVITEFSILNIQRNFLASGPDGTTWFGDSSNEPATAIFRVTTAGAMASTFVPQPGNWGSGAMLADGTGTWVMQVDMSGAGQHQILLLDASHAITRRINVPVVITNMTKGPDGNLWFIGVNGGSVSRVDASGSLVTFAAPGASRGIASGPDGNIWFSEPAANKIGRMDTNGRLLNEFPIPTPASSPGTMIAGPGNLVWFAEFGPPRLARITTGGTVTECAVATKNPIGTGELAAGPDGNVWMTGVGALNKVKVYRFLP